MSNKYSESQNISNSNYKISCIITRMKADGITISEIYKELEYRDGAASDCRWDDNLFEYSDSELEEIASLWTAQEIIRR